jgi:hypothetical protein
VKHQFWSLPPIDYTFVLLLLHAFLLSSYLVRHQIFGIFYVVTIVCTRLRKNTILTSPVKLLLYIFVYFVHTVILISPVGFTLFWSFWTGILLHWAFHISFRCSIPAFWPNIVSLYCSSRRVDVARGDIFPWDVGFFQNSFLVYFIFFFYLALGVYYKR